MAASQHRQHRRKTAATRSVLLTTFASAQSIKEVGLLSSDGERTAELLQALKLNTQLLELDLSSQRSGGVIPPSPKLMSALCSAIGSSSSLRVLNLSRTPLQPDVLGLLTNTLLAGPQVLQELNLDGASLGTNGACVLAQFVAGSKSVLRLSIAGNRIQNRGAVELAKALAYNTTLQSLNLGANWIREDGCEQVFMSLWFNRTLRTLDIQGNEVRTRGATSLAAALGRNTALTSLNLTACSIYADAALQLAYALRGSSTLSSLNLSENPLGDAGIMALGDSLVHTVSLAELSLEFIGGMTVSGISHLFASVARNSSLCSLNLKYNDQSAADEDGLFPHVIRDALVSNSSLRELHCGKFLGNAGLIAVTEALYCNRTLTSLQIEDQIDADDPDDLVGVLARNLANNPSLMSIATPRQAAQPHLAPLSDILQRNRGNDVRRWTPLLDLLLIELCLQ